MESFRDSEIALEITTNTEEPWRSARGKSRHLGCRILSHPPREPGSGGLPGILVSTTEGSVSGLLVVKQEMRTVGDGGIHSLCKQHLQVFNHQFEGVHHQGGKKKAKQEMQ